MITEDGSCRAVSDLLDRVCAINKEKMRVKLRFFVNLPYVKCFVHDNQTMRSVRSKTGVPFTYLILNGFIELINFIAWGMVWYLSSTPIAVHPTPVVW